MAHTSFSQSLTVDAPIEQVRAFLLDIGAMDHYHPLIIGVKEIEPDVSPFGTTRRRFEVTDRMRLGMVVTRFTYLATATLDPDQNVSCEAFQSPNIHLMIVYRCEATESGTRVTEQCDIDSPRLLMGTVRRQARKAHHTLLQGMKETLEHDAEIPTA